MHATDLKNMPTVKTVKHIYLEVPIWKYCKNLNDVNYGENIMVKYLHIQHTLLEIIDL